MAAGDQPLTRVYFSNDDVSPLPSLAFDGAWESNNSRRSRLNHYKGSDEITAASAVAYTAGHDFCYVQATSAPLRPGQLITNSILVYGQIQVAESNADDNIDQLKMGMRIVNAAGITQVTLLPVASYGGTAEFNVTTPRNKTFADGDALQGGDYMTRKGDRLVIELGCTDNAGLSPAVTFALGMAEEDCPVDETTTTERAGWVEFSTVLYFEPEVTRLWFPTTETTPVTPAFDSAWEDNNEAVRRRLRHIKDIANTLASGTPIVWTAGQDGLDRQYVSDPMVAGQLFSPAVTMQGMVRALESAVNDNVNQIKCGLRVFSQDGTTLRATLIAVGNHSGLSPSELGTTVQARRLLNTKALETTYITQDGDRLVFEIGFTDDGTGASIAATSTYGMSDGDAPYSFHGLGSVSSPWIEFSIPIQFKPGIQRFYFSHSDPAQVQCALDSEWEYTSEVRYSKLRLFKDESNIQAGNTIGTWTQGTDALDRQWVSEPMVAGIHFTTSVTVKMQLMVRETVTADDVTTAKFGLRIFDRFGNLKATLLPVANYSPTATEFPTVFTNKTFANGDALQADYVTEWGDRLVMEHGYRDLGGANAPDAASNLGCQAADLPEDETTTTNGAGWLEINGVDIYFMSIHQGPKSFLPSRTRNMHTALMLN